MTALTQSLPERKLKVNTIKFNEITRSEILKFSTRFHNEPTKKLMNVLDSFKTIKVNNVVETYEK
jgi:type I restriction enzyme S subunit